MAVISMYYLYHDSLHLKVTHESTPVFIVLLIMKLENTHLNLRPCPFKEAQVANA